MLPPTIVCAICHRGPSWHSTYKQDAAGNVVYGGSCAGRVPVYGEPIPDPYANMVDNLRRREATRRASERTPR